MRIIYIWIGLWIQLATAQTYQRWHYGSGHGLNTCTLYEIEVDERGELWIASSEGVKSYDGSEFRNYTLEHGLPENETFHLKHIGDNKIVAISYHNQYSVWDGNQFKTLKSKYDDTTKSDPSLLRENMSEKSSITYLNDYVFIGQNKEEGLNSLVCFYKGHFIDFHKQFRLPKHVIFSNSFQYTTDEVWILGTDPHQNHSQVLYALRPDTSFKISGYPVPFIQNLIVKSDKLIIRSKDMISTYTYDKDTRMLRKSENMIKIRNANNIFCIDSMIVIVCGSGYGYVHIYDLQLKQWKKENPFLGIPNIAYIAYDQFQNIWVSTTFNGLYRIAPSSNTSSSYGWIAPSATSYCFRSSKPSLIGDPLGNIYVRDKNENLPYYVNPKSNKFNFSNPVKQILEKESQIAVLRNTDLLLFNSNGKLASRYHDGRAYKYMSIAINGDLYIATSSAILHMSAKTQVWTPLLNGIRINTVYTDEMNKLWYSTPTNTYCMNTKTKKSFEILDRFSIGKSNVMNIYKSLDSILWLCSASKGIVGIKNGHTMWHIDTKSGLRYGKINTLYSVKSGLIWIGTNQGLYKIEYSHNNKNKVSITNYNIDNGLPDNNVLAIYVNKKQELTVATQQGEHTINEDHLNIKGKIYTSFKSIKINQKGVPIKQVYYLQSNENYISVKYNAVYYDKLSLLSYKYRIKELNNKWIATHERTFDIGPLNPGGYTIEVVCVDEKGQEMGPVAKFRAEISPAFYQQIWFKIMLILISILFGWFMIRWYIRKKGQEDQLKLELAELEMQAVRAQMNPHFIFNCLNSIQHMVNQQDTLNANRYIAKFSHLIRQTLELSKNNTIPLSEELSYIENYMLLETMRFQNSFDYQIIYDKDQDYNNYFIPSMIMQPYIENAIRHGVKYLKDRKGLITIEIIKNKDFIVCKIDDNGIGRTMSATHKQGKPIEYQSRGTELNQKRIDSYNVINPKKISIFIEDKLDLQGNPVGTCVHINLPV